MNLEKNITNSIIRAINNLPGHMASKRLSNGATSSKGYPDITGVIELQIQPKGRPESLQLGVRLEIEVKQPGKKPTKIQYARLRSFRRLNCIAFWTDSKIDAMNKLVFWTKVLSGKINHPGDQDLNPSKTS